MPLLLSDSLVVITKFLQVLLWISLPALFIGMLITTVIHYSNKRKRSTKNEEEPFVFEDDGSYGYDDLSLVPPRFYSTGSKQEVKRLLQHLSHSNARYIAVQKDLALLSQKYQQLQENNYHNSVTLKNKTMETTYTDTQQLSNDQMNEVRQIQESEKKQLLSELEQLNTAFEELEKTNSILHEQLNAFSSGETNVASIIQKWEQEKAELKKQINEHEYLKDVLEERKLQINFLQQQLEQRIKNHRLVEQQFRDLGIKFMETTEQLEIKEQMVNELQTTIHDKEQEIVFVKEVLQTTTENAGQLEISVKEMEERYTKLSDEMEQKNNLINDLQAQLLATGEARIRLEEKLENNQLQFKGLHRKLSDIIEEQVEASPVIAMKPVYKQENKNEQLTESATL